MNENHSIFVSDTQSDFKIKYLTLYLDVVDYTCNLLVRVHRAGYSNNCILYSVLQGRSFSPSLQRLDSGFNLGNVFESTLGLIILILLYTIILYYIYTVHSVLSFFSLVCKSRRT